MKTKTFVFDVKLEQTIEDISPARVADALSVVCGDCFVSCNDNEIYVEFRRESTELAFALESAFQDIEAAGFDVLGIWIERE